MATNPRSTAAGGTERTECDAAPATASLPPGGIPRRRNALDKKAPPWRRARRAWSRSLRASSQVLRNHSPLQIPEVGQGTVRPRCP